MKKNRQKVIVSMTTIPGRKKRLTDNIKSILDQSYSYDKLIINIDDNLEKEDYAFYNEIKLMDKRIKINKAEAKWRSCNKLLPTLKKYPDDIIVTLDDDIYYPEHCIKYLMEMYEKHPDCVIAHEVNPIVIKKDYVTYINGYDTKLLQVEWGKYLSNCALFPPHIFDGTDLFDYDKMIECTNGTHDELWFWVQSTINKVQCVGLNYVRSFESEMIEKYDDGEYCLSNVNNNDEKIDEYMQIINKNYGEKLIEAINSKPVVFTITKDNVYSFLFLLKYINILYKNYDLKVTGLTKNWCDKIIDAVKTGETKI